MSVSTQPDFGTNFIGSTPIVYGLLYNWYAVTDPRNITASGWHVPIDTDWDTLITYLGGTGVAAGKLKETGTVYFDSPNTGATNEVGFNGRGTGWRNNEGGFSAIKLYAEYLTTSLFISTYVICYELDYSDDDCQQSYQYLVAGGPVRFIKDSTSLSHGQTGIYTGNDGKIYRTICIGTQEWVADNLAETKYRNGDTISEVTNNVSWAALTTGALCAYNNDWNNV
jgi:uncharacterized protein (TIGR02145 family)